MMLFTFVSPVVAVIADASAVKIVDVDSMAANAFEPVAIGIFNLHGWTFRKADKNYNYEFQIGNGIFTIQLRVDSNLLWIK